MEDVAGFGHGPQFLGMVSQRQSPNYPYPDGTVHYILMSCVPDTNLNDIYEDLQPWQLGSIRRQLTTTLEYVLSPSPVPVMVDFKSHHGFLSSSIYLTVVGIYDCESLSYPSNTPVSCDTMRRTISCKP